MQCAAQRSTAVPAAAALTRMAQLQRRIKLSAEVLDRVSLFLSYRGSWAPTGQLGWRACGVRAFQFQPSLCAQCQWQARHRRTGAVAGMCAPGAPNRCCNFFPCRHSWPWLLLSRLGRWASHVCNVSPLALMVMSQFCRYGEWAFPLSSMLTHASWTLLTC